jgi:hypothetical protein
VTYATSNSLAAGTYTATIVITNDNDASDTFSIPVVLTLVPPTIGCSLTDLNLFCDIGGTLDSETFKVWNAGLGTLRYAISDDATWLTITPTPTTGTSIGEKDTFTMAFAVAALAGGEHIANITIQDNGSTPAAANSPLVARVTLTVQQPEIATSLDPARAIHAVCATGANPQPAVFTVSNSGTGALNFAVIDDASWLSCSPMTGTATTGSVAVTVLYDTASLGIVSPPATFTAAIEIDDIAGISSNGPITIDVTLLVDDDNDGDGLVNSEETDPAVGTDPNDADSDDDGLTDLQEVRWSNTDPLDWDSDGDGFSDGDEVEAMSDPNDADDHPLSALTRGGGCTPSQGAGPSALVLFLLVCGTLCGVLGLRREL